MPLINVKLIEDVFTFEQKHEIIHRLTDDGRGRRRAHAPRHLHRRGHLR